MHRFPILHKWFWIFAPGHGNSVQAYLDSKQQLGLERFRHPPEDHPVIYVSWFDAWAFCQWANWSCPETGVRYRCRLPHEPEWEFAARRARSDDGTGDGEPIPFDQPYWWGREFYFHEFSTDREPSGEPEPISNEFAHAIGTPAATRSPALSLPNGFGFHDILGNVWEWTASIYREPIQSENAPSGYSRHDPRQASSVPAIELRTMRGGLWYFLDLLARCSDRFRLHSDDRDYKMGFRVVRERV
jgi:formylglycine-generating enzyme required for sulfatase activity